MIKILSRYDTLRTFQKISNNIIKFNAYDTISSTISYNDSFDYNNNIVSLDPDGGPLIYKGLKIKLDNNEIYKIKSFKKIDYDREKKYLHAILYVDKEN